MLVKNLLRPEAKFVVLTGGYSRQPYAGIGYIYTGKEGVWPTRVPGLPSLRDVAQDGVLCTLSNRSAPDGGK